MSDPEGEPAVYVDALGGRHTARTIGKTAPDGRTLLLVRWKGHARITAERVRYSDRCEPGTWHRPPKPS